MQADPTITGKLYARMTSGVRKLDEALMQEYEGAISNIDQLRFERFRKCVSERHDSAGCFRECEGMELRPDLEGAGQALSECINKAAGGREWERAGEACLAAYERRLRQQLQGEINRVLKSL